MTGIRCEDVGGTAIVTLARPPANALDLELVGELRVLFEGYAADPPRGLVLNHDGPVFCAGVDMKTLPAHGKAERHSMAAEINAMITAFYGMPTATVAAIDGHTIGAGFVLMLACDVRLSSHADLQFGLTEVTAGVPFPQCPLEVVRAELGPDQQRSLALSGDLVGPEEALRAGILDETHTSDVLFVRAIELAQARSAAPAYRAVKNQLRGPALDRMRAIVAHAAPEPW